MLRLKLCIAGSAVMALCSPAEAGFFGWSGFYVGAHGGSTWSGPVFSNASASLNGASLDPDGRFGGVHAGYLLQLGGMVLGLEADYSRTGLKAAKTSTTAFQSYRLETNSDYMASVRARFGLGLGPLLVYGTAGLAQSELKVSGQASGLVSQSYDLSLKDTGIAYGAGVDWKVLPNLALRAEVLRYQFGFSSPINLGPVKLDSETTVVRAGLTYHFD